MFLLLTTRTQAQDVKVWLRVLEKRESFQIRNTNGLFPPPHAARLVQVSKEHEKLYLDGQPVSSLRIDPRVPYNNYLITKYSSRRYPGSFRITLKENKFHVINTIKLETYIKGVVGQEMGESFTLEALKAQAVLSRTYYLMTMPKQAQDHDVIDVDGYSQTYSGTGLVGPKTTRAVEETDGEIIIGKEGPFIPYFHSTCAGSMLRPEQVWDGAVKESAVKYQTNCGSPDKPFCSISPYFRWSSFISKKRIRSALEKRLGLAKRITDLNFIFNKAGYLKKVEALTEAGSRISMKGYEFRAYLEQEGINDIRSIRFKIKDLVLFYYVRGSGFGHLAGMCQWGAEFLGRKGMNYRQILEYYFPGSRIIRRGQQEK